MSITVSALQGDRVRITATFFDLETPAALADPSDVQFLHRRPDGTEEVFTFGQDAEIIKDGTGTYHADLLVLTAYTHYFRVNGYGAIAKNYETFVVVPESAFDVPLPLLSDPVGTGTPTLGAITSNGIGLVSMVSIIQKESDFPAAIGNVITLVDDQAYEIQGDVVLTTGNRLVAGHNTVIRGLGRQISTLTGDVAAPLITIPTAANVFSSHELSINQNNAAGSQIFATDGTLDRLELWRVQFQNNGGDCVLAGATDSVSIVECRMLDFARGFVPNVSGVTMILDGMLMRQSVGTGGNGCVDLGSNTFSAVARMSNVTMLSAASGFSLKGLASNGNFPAAPARGTVNNCRLVGPGTPLSGITVDDLKWRFVANGNILDSYTIGSYQVSGNISPTPLSGVSLGTFVKVVGITSAGTNPAPRRMTMTDNNEMTIDALDEASYTVNTTISASKSGGAVLYGFAVFAGGVQDGPTIQHEITGTITPTTISIPAQLSAGSFVDVRAVQLSGSPTDIICETLVTSIHGR